MKTRIKVVEYNSGKKEYHCQEYCGYFEATILCAISCLGLLCGELPIGRIWRTIDKSLELFSEERAIFDNEEEAKRFIDSRTKELVDARKMEATIKFLSKIKSKTYIKYP